jgi:CheY-like chemotaxis protein
LEERLRILYIEDNPDDQLTLKHLLEKEMPISFDLFAAETGTDGLKKIEEERFDLIFLDYKLPDMTGIELLRELQNRKVETPIIFVTGKGSEKTAVEAMKLGVQDYIVKDETGPSRLLESIREIMLKSSLPKEVDIETAKQLTGLFAESSIMQVEIAEIICSKPESKIPPEKLVPTLKKLVEIGILEAKPLRSAIVCPSCGSFSTSLRLQCPECKSVQLEKGEALEHLTCGNIDFRSKFNVGEEEFLCPKCRKKMKMIGVDYRKVEPWYKCSQNHFFGRPTIVFQCVKCNRDFTLDEAMLDELYQYQLTERGRQILRLSILGSRISEKQQK